jgi:hypothetical protein
VNISEFFSAMETVKINIDSKHKITSNGKDLYPVYIILFASNSFVSKSIRAFTKEKFSHAAISFDTGMTNIFSFGFRTNANDMRDVGNRRESLIIKKDRWLYEDDTNYGIYVKFMSLESIKLMKKRIHDIYNNTEKYKFSFIGLLKYAFNIPSENMYKMFCSQFVASLLQLGGVELDRSPSLYSAGQLTTDLNDVIMVEEGLVKDFKKSNLDRNMKILCNNIISN